jgi:ammonium transporter, Amt family
LAPAARLFSHQTLKHYSAAIVSGGIMHKVKPAPFLVFITLWSVLVYAPVARWTWFHEGWSNKLGVMDFAGGTPVHVISGATVAAFAVFCDFELSGQNFWQYVGSYLKLLWDRLIHDLTTVVSLAWELLQTGCYFCCHPVAVFRGQRSTNSDAGAAAEAESPDPNGYEPYSVIYVILGTSLLWFGWAGFNGGSALGSNLRAVSAWFSTHIAASAGGVTAMWLTKVLGDEPAKSFDGLAVLSFCDGAVAGLIAITPGSGFVRSPQPRVNLALG